MDIIASIFSGVRIILGLGLLLFVPGFLITLVFFPKLPELRFSERLVYSSVLSIGSVITFVLFMDLVLGIDTTPVNIIIALIGFSLILVILWILRMFFMDFSMTEKMSDLKKNARTRYASVFKGRKIREPYKNKPKDPLNHDDEEL
jgi:uncharacterized membrane protein